MRASAAQFLNPGETIQEVLDAGRWGMKTARDVADVLPRTVRLGPARGVWHSVELPSGKVWIHRRFFKDVEAADRLVAPVVNG